LATQGCLHHVFTCSEDETRTALAKTETFTADVGCLKRIRRTKAVQTTHTTLREVLQHRKLQAWTPIQGLCSSGRLGFEHICHLLLSIWTAQVWPMKENDHAMKLFLIFTKKL
jgi:hypothetical protein